MKEWAEWFEGADKRIVFQTKIGPAQVSTVFLGMDHSVFTEGDPVLWETMIFSDDEEVDDFQQRYTTYDAAVAGHTEQVTRMRERYGGESQ